MKRIPANKILAQLAADRAPIDVLAVMDSSAATLEWFAEKRAAELTEARAAVAELVGAANNARNVLELAIGNGAFGPESTDEADSADEAMGVAGALRAALAKFGGAA